MGAGNLKLERLPLAIITFIPVGSLQPRLYYTKTNCSKNMYVGRSSGVRFSIYEVHEQETDSSRAFVVNEHCIKAHITNSSSFGIYVQEQETDSTRASVMNEHPIKAHITNFSSRRREQQLLPTSSPPRKYAQVFPTLTMPTLSFCTNNAISLHA